MTHGKQMPMSAFLMIQKMKKEELNPTMKRYWKDALKAAMYRVAIDLFIVVWFWMMVIFNAAIILWWRG
jgi:CHASE3 domain sensor protein